MTEHARMCIHVHILVSITQPSPKSSVKLTKDLYVDNAHKHLAHLFYLIKIDIIV